MITLFTAILISVLSPLSNVFAVEYYEFTDTQFKLLGTPIKNRRTTETIAYACTKKVQGSETERSCETLDVLFTTDNLNKTYIIARFDYSYEVSQFLVENPHSDQKAIDQFVAQELIETMKDWKRGIKKRWGAESNRGRGPLGTIRFEPSDLASPISFAMFFGKFDTQFVQRTGENWQLKTNRIRDLHFDYLMIFLYNYRVYKRT